MYIASIESVTLFTYVHMYVVAAWICIALYVVDFLSYLPANVATRPTAPPTAVPTVAPMDIPTGPSGVPTAVPTAQPMLIQVLRNVVILTQ